MTIQYHGYTATEANANLDAIIATAAANAATAAANFAASVSYPVLPGEVGVTNVTAGYGNPLRYGGSGLGTLNDRAALLAADTAAAAFPSIAAVAIPPGTWRISADLTFTKPIIAMPGALLSRDAGVTVTFADAFYGGMGRHFSTPDTLGRFKFTVGTMKEVRPEWWGAKADYTVTDSTAGLQAAVDATIYGGAHCVVRSAAGGYKTTDTIHLGYGDTFTSVIVEGQGFAYTGATAFNGTALLPTKTDRPAVNFQGGRGSRLRGMAVIGKLGAYITTNNLGALAGANAGFDDTLAATWDDPSLGGATLDTRYAPYACITVDAYAGAQPATHYPAVVYPGWSGIVTQYNKAFSSDCRVAEIEAEGFTVFLANQPGDSDGNGDFTAIEKCNVTKCKYIVSIGNAQSRNVTITDLKASLYHTLLVGSKHGRQIGAFGGPVLNASVGAGINIVDLPGAGFSQGLSFINLYCEAQWRIGIIGSASSGNFGFVFKSCSMSFQGQNDVRGYPSMLLGPSDTSVAGNQVDIAFEQTTISVPNVCQLAMQGVSLNGLTLSTASARTNPYEKFAHNALSGGLVTYQLQTPRRSRVRFTYYNLDTAAVANTKLTDRWDAGTRPFCIPFAVEAVHATGEGDDPTLGRPLARVRTIDKTTLTGVSLVGRTYSFTMTTNSDSQALQTGPLPGDVLWDDTTGSVFFVRSRITTAIIAELQNNYRMVAGVATPIIPFAPSAGNLYCRNSRIYTPTNFLRGDLTAASATIANAARDDGFAAWFNTEITVGDALLVRDTQDGFVSFAGAVIAARDQTIPSITMAGGAARTQTRRRLDFFARQGPANV